MALIRVLRLGPESKALVDGAIDLCGENVGNLRMVRGGLQD